MTIPTAEITRLHPVLFQVVEQLKAYEPEQIILFGSRARGDAREFSDIDLIVVKDTGIPRRQRTIACQRHIPFGLGLDVDTIVYTPAEVEQMIESRSPFLAAAFTDGLLLYERNPNPGAPSLRARLKEPTMESRLRHGQGWLDSARHELRTCRLLLTPDTASGACFHAQQAAEKALKGFLIYCGLPLERTHSVNDLARSCAQQDHDFLACSEDARVLSGYYIDTRYAEEDGGYIFKTYELPEAEQAVERAERVIALVQSKIPPPPRQ